MANTDGEFQRIPDGFKLTIADHPSLWHHSLAAPHETEAQVEQRVLRAVMFSLWGVIAEIPGLEDVGVEVSGGECLINFRASDVETYQGKPKGLALRIQVEVNPNG